MSSFRPDPGYARRGFVPDRLAGSVRSERGFLGGASATATRSPASIAVDPAQTEAPREEPPPVWTADRVEALERDAFERGVASAHKATEALERACAALEAGAAGLRSTGCERVRAHRELMLDLAAEIAEAWVGRRLGRDRELLGSVLERALDGAGSLSPDRLLLCPADLAALLEVAEERIESWRERHGVDLVEEPSLGTGEFRIEARRGSVDGRIECLRMRLREALSEALGQSTARAGAAEPEGTQK